MHNRLNILAVILLIIIAIGMFTIPRFNYSVLVDRQAELEQQYRGLTTSTSERVTLLESSLDTLPQEVNRLRTILEEMTHNQTHLIVRLNTLEARIAQQRAPDIETSEEDGNRDRLIGGTWDFSFDALSNPVDLPQELQQSANKLGHVRSMAEWPIDLFLQNLVSSGVVPFEKHSDIPPKMVEDLTQLFGLFRAAIETIGYEESALVNSIVTEVTNSGTNYQEIGIADTEALQALFNGPSEMGITTVRSFPELGVKRVYSLPYKEFVEFSDLELRRSNARARLVLAANSVADRPRE